MSLHGWTDHRGGPPGPFQPTFWRSPLRGPWLTATLGRVLLCGLPIVMITGLLSNAAWDPRFAANAQGQDRVLGPFDIYLFAWPAHPGWLYAVNAGIHVGLGLALVPVVLAKQWSVLPRLFIWPPARTPAHALERLSLVFLVGGIYFEFVTGILFNEYWLPYRFVFDSAHYYGAWVFIGAFLLHVALKLPTMREALATRRVLLAASLAETVPEPPDGAPDSLVPVAPAAPTMSRRALLGTVGAGAVLLGGQAVAQDVGGPVRSLAFMLPRGLTDGSGPNDFPVNGTFASAGLSLGELEHWRLRIHGGSGRRLVLTRDQLRTMPHHSYQLTIACREGWSTTQRWTGVRLRDLAAEVGMHGPLTVTMTALDGAAATLGSNQVSADQTLLALAVNGAELSPDHGFPARLIVPDDIAVNCLKWVSTLAFDRAVRA
ncbi:MAG TPA: molybdopterin-dependent oxidoreductase [Solirubrobacteraceae bacterium]|nr:molybdopterin-dependent oxidoreductase [Solirubrobacteraceae bacterium]